MPPITPQLRQQAITWAFGYYDKNPLLPNSIVEFGSFLWEHPPHTLAPESPIVGKSKSVDIYSWDRVANLVVAMTNGSISGFVGDFHTHPDGPYYGEHLPSNYDLFQTSALCDWCEVTPGNLILLKQCLKNKNITVACDEGLPFSPRLQVVQPVRFGDLVVVEAVAGRTPFATLAQQKATLSEMEKKYKNLLHYHTNLGSIRDDKAGYRNHMQSIVSDANQIIGSRATMTYCPHP